MNLHKTRISFLKRASLHLIMFRPLLQIISKHLLFHVLEATNQLTVTLAIRDTCCEVTRRHFVLKKNIFA